MVTNICLFLWCQALLAVKVWAKKFLGLYIDGTKFTVKHLLRDHFESQMIKQISVGINSPTQGHKTKQTQY